MRTDGIVFEHTQWPMCARPRIGLVVARHGHADEADGDGSGFGWQNVRTVCDAVSRVQSCLPFFAISRQRVLVVVKSDQGELGWLDGGVGTNACDDPKGKALQPRCA